MKKLTYLFLALLIVACSSDDSSDGSSNDGGDNGDNEQPSCIYNLNTLDVEDILTTSVVLNGTIITEDIENCELPNTEQGFVYSNEVQPTIEDTQINVNGTDISTTLENLEPNTTYYARTFLTNALGEFYGNEVSFMTSEEPIDCEVVYLDENGITIKAYECAEVGDTGVIDGVIYTVVDEAMLREMVANEEDITKVVTTFVTDMNGMFNFSNLNQPIGNWDVSNVTEMRYMFYENSSFNQPIGDWDVSNVTDMSYMFKDSVFNQPIGDWDVSSVTDMSSMFGSSVFNQPIGNWDVSNVTDMQAMFFQDTAINQDLSNWNVSSVNECSGFNYNTPQWTLPKPNLPSNCLE